MSLRWNGGQVRDASEGGGPQRGPQKRLDRRLEGVAKAVGGGYFRLQMPLKLALGVWGTVAGHRLGALEGGQGGGVPPPPSNASLARGLSPVLGGKEPPAPSARPMAKALNMPDTTHPVALTRGRCVRAPRKDPRSKALHRRGPRPPRLRRCITVTY